MTLFGLTVYGPEVARSGLTVRLDDFIRKTTGLQIEERFFSIHSRSSIEAFYSLTGSSGGKHWPLVLDLFDLRPGCATIWRGSNALEVLQKLKGTTQPALAAAGTVRSRFHCDNPVTNLIHVSDSERIMADELKILRAQSTGEIDECWLELDTGYTTHSSLLVLLRLLGAPINEAQGIESARAHAMGAFEQIRSVASGNELAKPVEEYFLGRQSGLASLLTKVGRVSAWDDLILQAGLFAMPVWRSVLGSPSRQRLGAG
ncbi:nucleoside diphosphate kinase [Sinorhizobium meliloti]|uniref:nucleoside-diphosphate kinase n=1 Tax=Rhizobium meliloti TaxID=382 RepID=UPI000FDCB71F|nr:nucleoside-diphosphate kinase [Sinorhizobium meliloti]RVK43341.1 nucleoside-diphosphate kinase [Sinorhizobium meliloti]